MSDSRLDDSVQDYDEGVDGPSEEDVEAALQQVQVEAVPAGGVRIGAAAPPPEDLVDSGMDEMD